MNTGSKMDKDTKDRIEYLDGRSIGRTAALALTSIAAWRTTSSNPFRFAGALGGGFPRCC